MTAHPHSGHPLAGYSTATVSDALDRLGRPGSLLGIAPLFDGARLCGPAFTVRYMTAGSPPGTVGDYLDDVPPGAVVVLDNGGRVDCTVWGDILTAMAADRGAEAREALPHLVLDDFPPARVHELRAWFAARRGDSARDHARGGARFCEWRATGEIRFRAR